MYLTINPVPSLVVAFNDRHCINLPVHILFGYVNPVKLVSISGQGCDWSWSNKCQWSIWAS